MKRTLVAALLLATLSITGHAETRCGIITNSLPGGELTLDDRDAAWQLDANGVPDKMPDTNRGEQCGCVTGTTDPKDPRVHQRHRRPAKAHESVRRRQEFDAGVQSPVSPVILKSHDKKWLFNF